MMKMRKKGSALLLTLLLVSAMAGCGKTAAPAPTTAPATTAAAEVATGTYTLYNVTGEKLTELYLYETGSDKGENHIPEGMKNNK